MIWKQLKKKVAKIPTDSGVRSVTTKPSFVEKERSGPMFGILPFVELFLGDERAKKLREDYISSGVRYQPLKEELSEAIFKELETNSRKEKIFRRSSGRS